MSAIAYCLFPLLLYYVVYEAAVYVLSIVRSTAAAALGATAAAFTAAHTGDLSALIGAVAMAAGFLAIRRTAAAESPLTWRIRSRMPETAAAVCFALSASLFLNLVISLSGAQASDAGASSAAAQTSAVSLPLGLLYYGILSPFIEETVFRGITLGRIRTALHGRSASGADPAAGGEDPSGRSRETGRRYFITAAVLSSLLFGIYHGNPVQGGYAFCMGLILCGFLKLTGCLTAAALLHGAVNVLTLVLSQSGAYANLCTPAWLTAFAGITACSAGALIITRRRTGS